ncbi:MAG: complex I NDUFA9 subunit family protein [Alphaproteobacteria bacterium]|nr:complex I NDUFA9 subunit family protein [Alphaproteobacteria bacterium]
MQNKRVTVFGGTGFLGSYLIPKLMERGAIVRVAVRERTAGKIFPTVGNVGTLEHTVVNFAEDSSLSNAVKDSDYVINLIGILSDSTGIFSRLGLAAKTKFSDVHTSLSQKIAEACLQNHVEKMILVTSIGANKTSPSSYLSSKGLAEEEVLKKLPHATVIRPSVIFGAEDQFFNRFAAMSLFSPFLPLIASGKAKLQPVYVGDVAEAIVKILVDQKTGKDPHAGKIYELGGPSVYSFKDLMEFIQKVTLRKRRLLSIPYTVARLMGGIMQQLPHPLLTRDQAILARIDNVVSKEALTFHPLGIIPKSMESIVPGYLQRFQKHC